MNSKKKLKCPYIAIVFRQPAKKFVRPDKRKSPLNPQNRFFVFLSFEKIIGLWAFIEVVLT
jgi:hypothetical protein